MHHTCIAPGAVWVGEGGDPLGSHSRVGARQSPCPRPPRAARRRRRQGLEARTPAEQQPGLLQRRAPPARVVRSPA